MEEKIFKSYDIRGIYPEEINEDLTYKIAQAYVKVVKPEGKVVVGMDVRNSSPLLKKSIIDGLIDAGIDVVDIGLVSTEMYYFAVGFYKYAGGIQVTASHNPAEYGGIKMVRQGPAPVSAETGIYEIRDLIKAGKENPPAGGRKGQIGKKDVLDDFVKFALEFSDTKSIKPLKLVYNPNFGYEGEVLKRAVEMGNLPIELVGLNDTPDGNFPKGRPDPFVPESRPEFVQLVKDEKADLGVAWDADGDRVFFCDENGRFVESYYANALLIKTMLAKYPGGKIVYDPRYTWALIDSIKENGGEAVVCRVGHSFIKEKMRQVDAVFCGESSGHIYFRDFYYSDSGLIPLLLVLELISKKGSLGTLLKPYFDKYFISGEINTEVKDQQIIIDQLKNNYADGELDEFDGISIEYPDWRFNVRSSNTEPLLRLNLEARSQKLMAEKRDEVLKIFTGI